MLVTEAFAEMCWWLVSEAESAWNQHENQCYLVLDAARICQDCCADPKRCMRLHEVIFVVSPSTITHLSTSFFVPGPNFVKALLLKAFRPWGCPAMPSALAVRGPGFPEDAPRKAGRSYHRRFCARPNWTKLNSLATLEHKATRYYLLPCMCLFWPQQIAR